jgi:aspartate aminotransferase
VNHHYTPTAGLPELRAQIATKTLRDSGYEVKASQVLVTNGAKQAVFQTFATLCDPGDEVLIPAPYWTTYPEAVKLAGAEPVAVPTDERFHMDFERLEAALTPATKVLLFVSPSNPSGAVMTPEETEAIAGHTKRDCGSSQTRSTSTSSTAPTALRRCRLRCPRSQSAVW